MKPDSALARLLKSWQGTESTASNQALEELQSQFEAFRLEANANLEEVGAKLTETLKLVETLEAERDAYKAQVEQAASQALEAKASLRLSKLAAVVGTEKAAATVAQFHDMSDEQFEAVLDLGIAASNVEKTSPMFQEKGVSADLATIPEGEEMSKEMKILVDKYGPNRAN